MYNFEVHKPNIQTMEKYLKDQESRRSQEKGPDITWWDFPQGLSIVRILPPWDPTGRIALAVHSHRIPFQGTRMRFTKYNWVCLNATFGKPCGICEGLAEMQAAGVNTDEWGPWHKRFYSNAIIIHDPVYHAEISAGKNPQEAAGLPPGTHVILKKPKTVYDWIVSQITNPMIGDITDLQSGIDVYVTREGVDLGTKYTPTLSPNGRQPVPQEYLNNIKALHNLDEIFSQGFDQELIEELITHLKKSSGLIIGGGIASTHAAMGGYAAPGVPTVPPGVPGAVTPASPVGAPVPPTPPTPPAPPAAPEPQKHIDAAGNEYHLINNQWVLVKPVAPQPPAPPAPPAAAPTPPAAPSVPTPPPTPAAPSVPPTPPVPPAAPSAAPAAAPPTPPSAPTNPPMVSTAPPAGAPPSAPADGGSIGRPQCFGRHNAADVNCVVCPHELDCSAVSGGN